MSEQNEKGRTFEVAIGRLLDFLATNHPDMVEVTHHPRLELHNGESVIPDYELVYDLGFQKDHRLIECQNRERSSSDIVHKIRHVKSLSGRNRFVFVYAEEDFLTKATRHSLEADGISFYSVDGHFCISPRKGTLRGSYCRDVFMVPWIRASS